MGDIIYQFIGMKPSVHIERSVDRIETQKLRLVMNTEAWLATETGDSVRIFGRDEDCNTIEVQIPISAEELKEALERYLGR